MNRLIERCAMLDVHSEELAAILLRADGLEFCRRRVATALENTAPDLAQIERHAGLPSNHATRHRCCALGRPWSVSQAVFSIATPGGC